MEPYNFKGKMNRLVVSGFPNDAEINAAQGEPSERFRNPRQLMSKTHSVTSLSKLEVLRCGRKWRMAFPTATPWH